MNLNKTVNDNIKWATKQLNNSGIESSRLDSLILLEHVTGIDRAKLLADDDRKLTKKQNNLFSDLVVKRSNHVPITQLVNGCEFYGRRFYINEFVMSPRPETEKMVELFLDLIKTNKELKSLKKIKAADIGTGSGAIGITIKKEAPEIDIDLIDNDPRALKIAKINVVLHTIGISTIHSNLIEGLDSSYDVLLCNLPYVPDKLEINDEAKHEPKKAIFGGDDGLSVYRQLFSSIKKMKNKPLLILTESFPKSHKSLKSIAQKSGYSEIVKEDFIQAFQLI